MNRDQSLPNGPHLWDALIQELTPVFGVTPIIIAGGAIRDHCIGADPKDIDIFVWGDDTEEAIVRDDFCWLKPLPGQDEMSEYEDMPDVLFVWEGKFAGHDINVILMHSTVPVDGLSLVNTFDFDITRGWWDGSFHTTPEMGRAIRDKHVTMLIDAKRERSIRRFNRFNARHDNRFKLFDKDGQEIDTNV